MSEIRSRHGRHRFSYGRRAVDAAAPISLRGRRLQVIVKAANYILRSGEEYNGSWHVEGLPSEGIVCTAIHYYDTTPDVVNGMIAFRRVLDEELDSPQTDTTRYAYPPDEYSFDMDDPDSKAAYERKLEEYESSYYKIEDRPKTYSADGAVDVACVETPPTRSICFVNSLQVRH